MARETAEQVLDEWGIGRRHRAVGTALLILGELVTHVVRHPVGTSPRVTVIHAAGKSVWITLPL